MMTKRSKLKRLAADHDEPTVHDVAQYIIDELGTIDTMKLQKLCYFAQGWSLTKLQRPLFREPIEAWRMGPVIRALYRHHRGQARVSDWNYADADSSRLSRDQRIIVSTVVNAYRHTDGFKMGRDTHKHTPWIEAYKDASPAQRGQVVMPEEEIRKYFDELAEQL